jgi:hypothetical protein
MVLVGIGTGACSLLNRSLESLLLTLLKDDNTSDMEYICNKM